MRRVIIDVMCVFLALINVMMAATAIAQPPGEEGRRFVVCHGEYQTKCREAPVAVDVFGHCGQDNGVSSANPNASIIWLCGFRPHGVPNGRVEPSGIPSISGNHCGYSWYVVQCI
jgi:hypothetical protein